MTPPIFEIEIEDVFDARIAWSGKVLASPVKIIFFISKSSFAASTMKSTSFRALISLE